MKNYTYRPKTGLCFICGLPIKKGTHSKCSIEAEERREKERLAIQRNNMRKYRKKRNSALSVYGIKKY